MRHRSITCLLLMVVVVVLASSALAADAAKPLRVGIIGTTTSHVKAFTKTINDPKATGVLADYKVVAGFTGGMKDNPSSWDRREMFTQFLRDEGCTIYDTIEEMVKNVDCVLLESVDARPHLEQAKPVIAAGKPLFIDKPMAVSLADVMEIFRLAKEKNVPVFSSSSLRYGEGVQEARNYETSPFGVVKTCVAQSPMSTEPHHPDLFWYGIHGCETLFAIMGTGCQSVKRVSQTEVVGTWEGGRTGTFVGKKGYGAEIVGSKSSGKLGKYGGYKPLVVEFCKFFKTGVAPVPAEETIELFAFMEAADESKAKGGAAVTIKSMIDRAKKINAERNKK